MTSRSARPFVFLAFLSAGVGISRAEADPFTLTVNATANIFGAGQASPPGGGTLPPFIALTGNNLVVSFSSVTGSASDGAGPNPSPDGGACCGGSTDLFSVGSISGIQHDNSTFFLTGLFTGDTITGPAPERLHFSTGGGFTADDFTDLFPMLDQTFFIGDGLTGTGTGSSQLFHVPLGATHLWIGLVDGADHHGVPGLYGDNFGSYIATGNVDYEAATVPEPASLLLLGTGLLTLVAGRRRCSA